MIMKKSLVPLLFIFALSITWVSAFASSVDVAIQPSSQAGQTNSVMKFILTITNNQDFHDSFQIVFSGSHMEWLVPGIIAKGVAAHSSEDLDVIFYPTKSGNEQSEFSVSVYSVSNSQIKSSAYFSVDVSSGIEIKDFKASLVSGNSVNSVNFDLWLYSSEEKEASGEFMLEDASGRKIGALAFKQNVKGDSKISRDLVLVEGLPAGSYTARASLEGIDSAKKAVLYIQPVRSITQTVEEVQHGFTKDVTITIRNEGNTIERGYSVQQAIPMDAMTGMLSRPGQNCREEDGAMVCNYFVGDIKPGSAAYVVYSVNYWPAFNGYLLISVIMAGLIIYSFLRVTSPRILKRHSRKGENVHAISIHIKNPFLRNLRDVTVRDWVSPLAQVLHEEITSTVPVLRRADEGTELIWKLGDMKPKEERILQYKVHSLVKGRLRMPSAQMRFASGRGDKKMRLASNAITLD